MTLTLQSVLEILSKPDCEEAEATNQERIPIVLKLPNGSIYEVKVDWIHLTDSDSTPYTHHAIVISLDEDQTHLEDQLMAADEETLLAKS